MKSTSHQYDAFISYSHKADWQLAKLLQTRLERWAKPWYATRTAKLFRDQTSLTATPHLWPTIADSLDHSNYLVLLASTDAAKSAWVPREICYWVTGGKCTEPDKLQPDQVVKDRVDRLMLVLTEGQIEWSHAEGDFDWTVTTALPGVMRKLPWQPLWIDLRWARGMDVKQIEVHEGFTEAALKVLSPIREQTPQELRDANDLEQKKAISLFRRLSVGLAVALVLAIVGGFVAWHQRELALERERAARHEQGLGWLARSQAAERRRDYLASKLMAMKAINYSGFGPTGTEDQDLLMRDSEDYQRALARLVSLPDCNLIFAAALDGDRRGAASQCAFSESGTQLQTIADDGASMTTDFRTGKTEHTRVSKVELEALSRAMRFNLFRHFQTKGSHPISSKEDLGVTMDGQQAFAVWSQVNDPGPATRAAIPEAALRNGENDDEPKLVNLTSSAAGDLALATFQNRFVQAVVACRRETCAVVYQTKGEMSGDSGVMRSVGTCVSPDGKVIVVGESNGLDEDHNRINVYRRNSDGSFIESASIVVDGEAVHESTISRSNHWLAGASGRTIHLWDLRDQRMVLTLTGHGDTVRDIEFSPDERTLASVDDDGVLLVWSLPLVTEEQVALRGLSPALRNTLFAAGTSLGNAETPDGKLHCSSSSGALRAEWHRYWSASGLGDEMSYGQLSIIDTDLNLEIANWAIVDAPRIEELQFGRSELELIAKVTDDDDVVFPFSRPRRRVDYKAAYALVEFESDGITFRKDSPSWREGRVPIPANLSAISISETVSPASVQEALRWHYERLRAD